MENETNTLEKSKVEEKINTQKGEKQQRRKSIFTKKSKKRLNKQENELFSINKPQKKNIKNKIIENKILNNSISSEENIKRRSRRSKEQLQILNNFLVKNNYEFTNADLFNLCEPTGLKYNQIYKWIWDAKRKFTQGKIF